MLTLLRLVLQVVDIVSTWRSLGPELSCDSRPLVVKVIAELLALVPQLTVKSDEYEVPVLRESQNTATKCISYCGSK